jgi:hypothetical protein
MATMWVQASLGLTCNVCRQRPVERQAGCSRREQETPVRPDLDRVAVPADLLGDADIVKDMGQGLLHMTPRLRASSRLDA